MKTQSLSARADMFPVKIYGEQVAEIPNIEDKGSLSYFGSSCYLRLTKLRRDQMGIEHSKVNTLAFENDNYFVNASEDDTNAPATYKVVPYEEHIEKGLDKDVKWAVRNVPFNYPGQGATKLWPDIIKADNKNSILDYQSDVLPIALMRGNDSDLKDMRHRFLHDYGLYKVRPYPFKTFLEWNAKVPTAGYFCIKDFDDDITVKTDISDYQYDFRSKGIIVTPDTKDEVDFIFSCLDKESYIWNSVSLTESVINTKSMKIKNDKLFSFTKTSVFKHPMVIKLNKNGTYLLGYTSEILDTESINYDKIVTPYQCSGYASGRNDLGNVTFVPAGIQLMSSYRWTPINKDEEKYHINYLQSLPVNYLLENWRTSQTNDAPQLKIIPKLTEQVTNVKDILIMLGGQDLEKEIINGYNRKITA